MQDQCVAAGTTATGLSKQLHIFNKRLSCCVLISFRFDAEQLICQVLRCSSLALGKKGHLPPLA